MFKQITRWLVAMLALTLIALAALFSPILAGHAAPTHKTHPNGQNVQYIHHHDATPNLYWHP